MSSFSIIYENEEEDDFTDDEDCFWDEEDFFVDDEDFAFEEELMLLEEELFFCEEELFFDEEDSVVFFSLSCDDDGLLSPQAINKNAKIDA